MSEMVERIAKAMEDDIASFDRDWDATPAQIAALARVALVAMREPTAAILKAGMDLGGYIYGDDCYTADPTEIWHAMIDEALE